MRSAAKASGGSHTGSDLSANSGPTVASAATLPPNAPAPTVPLANAQAAQLEAARATSTTVDLPFDGSNSGAGVPVETAAVGLSTPEAASRNLWDSWQDKDWERAVLYASPAAAKELFSLPWTPETVDQGCSPTLVTGSAARCLFVQGATVRVLEIRGSTEKGYKVYGVTKAQVTAPQISTLPNVDAIGVPGTGVPGTDVGGVPVDPNLDPSLGVPQPGGPEKTFGTTVIAKSTKGRTTKAKSSIPKTKKKVTATKPTSSQAPSVEPAPSPAAVPEAPSPTKVGVPAAAPVVNQVENG